MFPFERVPQGSRIVIYGAGVKGQSYLRQMLMTGYCTVVALADQNYAGYPGCVVPVCDPETIHALAFDVVVIALKEPLYLQEFRSVLLAQGIPEERIIYQPSREAPLIFAAEEAAGADRSHALLLYLMGGFGDIVVQKKVIETLIALAPEVSVDIVCDKGLSFLEYLYEDTPQVRKIALNLGTHFAAEKSAYAASLMFSGMGWIQVETLQEGRLPAKLEEVLRRLKERAALDPYVPDAPAAPVYYRSRYRKENCYQHLSYDGIVPYTDTHVHIPRNDAGRAAFQALGLGDYITTNFGNGDSKNLGSVAKAWPKERFEQVIAGLHERYPRLLVVQLGATGATHLSGADRFVFGTSFSTVSEVLAHSRLHIDIEGGLVHLATQLGTKCVVLFGPTMETFYGYPENINLCAGSCHDCYGLYTDWNRCVREMREPECMYSITPEMVLEAVRKCLKQREE